MPRLICWKGSKLTKPITCLSVLYECIICHYWYFIEKGFEFKPEVHNSCHDLMQKATSFDHVAVVYVKENEYRVHSWYMSKDDVINLRSNADLS